MRGGFRAEHWKLAACWLIIPPRVPAVSCAHARSRNLFMAPRRSVFSNYAFYYYCIIPSKSGEETKNVELNFTLVFQTTASPSSAAVRRRRWGDRRSPGGFRTSRSTWAKRPCSRARSTTSESTRCVNIRPRDFGCHVGECCVSPRLVVRGALYFIRLARPCSTSQVGWLKARDQTILALHKRVITHNARIDVDHEEDRSVSRSELLTAAAAGDGDG